MRTRTAVLVMFLAVLMAGCGSGTTILASPPASSVGSRTPIISPAGPPPNEDLLCRVFARELAAAALGETDIEGEQGEVLPRPNGVYCRWSVVADANTNVEAQLKDATQAEFDALATTMGADIPLAGVGEAAFRRDSSSFGGGGATVVASGDGKLATVILNREGADQALMNIAVEAIANAVLAASP